VTVHFTGSGFDAETGGSADDIAHSLAGRA
jgi:hypothetical protein